jgi:hypothetical protein
MKIFNLKSFLNERNIEDCELFHIVNYLKIINININSNGPWIAGGSILRTLIGLELSTDVDIFFSNVDNYQKTLSSLSINAVHLKSTDFSDTFKIVIEYNNEVKNVNIQLIKFIFKEKASEIISCFDLNICQLAFDGKNVMIHPDTLIDIFNKKVKINVDMISNSKSTVLRCIKYATLGFNFDIENLSQFTNKYVIMPNNSPIKLPTLIY